MSAEQSQITKQERPTVGVELSLPARALAAMKLKVTAEQLTELAAKTADIQVMTNADGRTQVHAAAMALADQRLYIDKAGKLLRDLFGTVA